jgi:hypothetical protein
MDVERATGPVVGGPVESKLICREQIMEIRDAISEMVQMSLMKQSISPKRIPDDDDKVIALAHPGFCSQAR